MKQTQINIHMLRGKTVFVLPAKIATQVGHVVSRWAQIERVLNLGIYNVSGVHEVVAKLVIGTGHAEDQFGKIQDLLMLANILLGPRFKPVPDELVKLRKLRDKVAHGHWIRTKEHGLAVLDTGGNWTLGPHTPKIKKRAFPDPVSVDVPYLKQIVQRMDDLFQILNGLNESIRELRRSSPERLPPLRPQ